MPVRALPRADVQENIRNTSTSEAETKICQRCNRTYKTNECLVCLQNEEYEASLVEDQEKLDGCTSDDDLREIYADLIEQSSEVGFIIPVNRMTRQHIPLLRRAFVENQVAGSKEELDQFIEGLETHQLLSFLRLKENVVNARPLFSGKVRPVTAVAVRNLLEFKYSEGNLVQKERLAAQGFTAFLQASKGEGTSVNNIRVKPQDILMWLTGATHIPAAGFHKKIEVFFGESLHINTCALCVTLKLNDMSIEQAVEHYAECLINSQTFTME